MTLGSGRWLRAGPDSTAWEKARHASWPKQERKMARAGVCGRVPGLRGDRERREYGFFLAFSLGGKRWLDQHGPLSGK